MPKVVALVGPAGEALEELALGLAVELEKKGQRVGVITRREAAAAEPSCRIDLLPGGVSSSRRTDNELSLDELAGRYGEGLDILLTLAHPEAKHPKIELCAEGQPPSLAGDSELLAVVGAADKPTDTPCFASGDAAGLAALLANKLADDEPRPHTKVVLGGLDVPIKDFVQDIVADTIRAMIATLKGGDRKGRLDIFID